MKFFTVIASLAVFTAVAASPVETRQVYQCASGSPQCCATDVLGLADLDCASPPTTPTSQTNFIDICADIGQRARCCILPVLGQALICSNP
ncbi:cerato-ulmin [Atractiella rhizophila]|nr:cerato-ulmin [Atractiella rhizophila]